MIIVKLFLPFLFIVGRSLTEAFVLWTIHPTRHSHHYRLGTDAPTLQNSAAEEDGAVVADSPLLDAKQRRNNNNNNNDVLTSVLFQVSYDGGRFSGWSSGNSIGKNNTTATTNTPIRHSPRSSRRKRNRHLHSADSCGIRSVQGVLQLALAKIYGNVDPSCIVVEGASRTDKGVHAYGMVTHVYGVAPSGTTSDTTTHNNDGNADGTKTSVIPGKRLPHPRNATDTSGCFLSLPMSPAKMAFTLNRMLPPDVRIMRYAITNTTAATANATKPPIFHASRSATGKTYMYRLAQGPRADPTAHRTTWYIGKSVGGDDDNRDENVWDSEALHQVAQLLTASAYNFSAFAGAPRGVDDKRKRANQSMICRLYSVDIETPQDNSRNDTTGRMIPSYQEITIAITGDRFLYRMMRFLVGTLVAVARHDIAVQDVETMLSTGSRSPFPRIECAPAHGLVLKKVHYGNIENTDHDNDDNGGLKWELANS